MEKKNMGNTVQNGKLNRKKQYQSPVKSMGSLDFCPCSMDQVSIENLITDDYGISFPFTEASMETYENAYLSPCGVCWLPVLCMLSETESSWFQCKSRGKK